MSSPKPVAWITGAAGLIGSHILEAATAQAPEYEAFGLTRSVVDLTDFAAVRALFQRQRPSLIIHCAAMSRSPDCQAAPGLARRVNVESTTFLSELAAEIDFLFFSTDLVFDGSKGGYCETDLVNPLSVYAETKAVAEARVLKNPRHVVVRTSITGGATSLSRNAFNQELRRAWAQGKTTHLFEDEFRCPISATVTARAVWELARRRVSGVFHLAGGERLSRLQIGQLLAARHPGLRPRIQAGSLREYHGAPRSPDCSLDLTRIHSVLSFRIPGLTAWLAENPGVDF